mmetsp:Transcript_8410/g.14197  ORF Transcript_8410/g.14197 Transcript_8410/m.14197 type:complete len:213 (+) Transcript_8410:1415-2053(+)
MHLGARHTASDCHRRHHRPQLGEGQGPVHAVPHEQDPARDPSHPLVPAGAVPGLHGGVPSLLRHLYRAALHLRLRVGSQAVHAVRRSLDRLHHAHHSHVVHHDRPDLLPACDRGPQVVVALTVLGGLDWLLCVRLLLLLLLRALRDVRFHADLLLLRLHADRRLRGLHHARYRRLRVIPRVRATYLPGHQMRLNRVRRGARDQVASMQKPEH